jgi:E3 ubiquitin-protein ligase HUWE1
LLSNWHVSCSAPSSPIIDTYVFFPTVGTPPGLEELKEVDEIYFSSLEWITKNTITDIIFETFSVTIEKGLESQTIDLIEGGRNIHVTESNKHNYVEKVIKWKLEGSVQEQIYHILYGA